jgi:NAD(P)-dependent dehydrogenase (short-subunit alcohol dehydrogenase family)
MGRGAVSSPAMSGTPVAILHDADSKHGLLFAVHLSKAGMQLVLPYSGSSEDSPERAQQACDRLRQSVPGAVVTALHLDRQKPESITRFVEEFAARFTRLDLLFIGANVAHVKRGEAGATSIDFRTGLFSLLRGLWPLLGQAGPSRIVLQTFSLVPLSAREPLGSDASDYVKAMADKDAMETSLTRLLAREGASRDIAVQLWSLFGIRDLDGRSWLYRLFLPLIEGSRGNVVLTSQQAADMLIYLATSPVSEAKHYIFGRREGFPLAPYPKTDAIAQRLWDEAGEALARAP